MMQVNTITPHYLGIYIPFLLLIDIKIKVIILVHLLWQKDLYSRKTKFKVLSNLMMIMMMMMMMMMMMHFFEERR